MRLKYDRDIGEVLFAQLTKNHGMSCIKKSWAGHRALCSAPVECGVAEGILADCEWLGALHSSPLESENMAL